MNYNEIEGDLIDLAKQGKFDVITHGCNCFNNMGAGIAPLMANAFGCDKFNLEKKEHYGDVNKLGQIDYETFVLLPTGERVTKWNVDTLPPSSVMITVVNSYSQYNYGRNHLNGVAKPLDYEALTLCLRKINKKFMGQRIGLPKIGAGLAGGDWNIIKQIIQTELKDCQTTVVILPTKK